MDKVFITLSGRGEGRYEDRGSVFLGVAVPIRDEQDAAAIIKERKKEFHDARHHVYAYILPDGMTRRYSDDGEPQGSAGMPMLNVLQKKEIYGACAVVTRYFGGTLLGTGGLVQAYTQATVNAVEAAGLKKYERYTAMSVRLSYSDYQRLTPMLTPFTVIRMDAEFTDAVTVRFSARSDEVDRLVRLLSESGNGRWDVNVFEESWDC